MITSICGCEHIAMHIAMHITNEKKRDERCE